MTIAITFPGQGSQAVSMGKALAEASPAAREVFEEVDEALGQNLSRLMFEGPEDELTLTENAQPALMAVSMAVCRTLEWEGGLALSSRAAFAAGHSLGEYSALATIGSFSLPDAARLLKKRGQAMQAAVPVGEGAMAVLLGLEFDAAAEVVAEAGSDELVCACANDNAPGQMVISGSVAAIEAAVELAKEKGARKAMMLPVSAPFHCPLMQPAADVMEEALAKVDLSVPSVPLVSNIVAAPTTEPAEIKSLLVQQVTGMVRWRESVAYMAENSVDTIVELGAGQVLSGLAKRIDRSLTVMNAAGPDDIDTLIQAL